MRWDWNVQYHHWLIGDRSAAGQVDDQLPFVIAGIMQLLVLLLQWQQHETYKASGSLFQVPYQVSSYT